LGFDGKAKECAIMKRFWKARGLWLLAALALLSRCAAGDAYRGAGPADAYVSPLPPALRSTDPALRHWYTAPYFDPYESP
jgi:hypothetical protein